MGYFLPQELPQTASQPAAHLHKLLRLSEFAHLRDGEAKIEFLMRGHEQVRGGQRVLGSAHLPNVQGQLKDVFLWMLEDKFGYLPDVLCVIDSEWWLEVKEREREIQIHHLLSRVIHKVDKHGEPRFNAEGNPEFGLVDPDVMEFITTVRRYGPHNDTIRAFLDACDGEKE